jgi:hypothetical protein
MTPPKESCKTLSLGSKVMETNELPEKELNIMILRKLKEIQEI